MTAKVKDISRGIRLQPKVWAALERLRKQHGSYNKALREVLAVDAGDPPKSRYKAVAGVVVRADRKPGRKVKQGQVSK